MEKLELIFLMKIFFYNLVFEIKLYFFIFKKYINKNYKKIQNSDIKYFWENYNYTSIYSKQKRSKKQIKYQNYLENNNALSTFQVDLVTFKESDKKNNKDNIIYVLLCIDEVSKFAFCSFLKRKLSYDVREGFISIIKKIKLTKKKNVINNLFSDLTFYADFGQEFLFKDVKNYLISVNSKIINIGMPSVTKLGIIERLIRTIQEMLSVNLNNISTKSQYKKEFKYVLKLYNKSEHTYIKTSPDKFLKSQTINLKPWDISKNSKHKFDYFLNKKVIKKKLQIIKKKYPLNQSVRIFKKIKKNYKKTHFSTWSNEIFYIDGYKIPLLKESDIGIYIKNNLGQRVKGIMYEVNLKKVTVSDYMEIKNIISFMNRKKALRCSFYNYPDSFYKDIKLSDLNNYVMSKKIRKRINDWKIKHGF